MAAFQRTTARDRLLKALPPDDFARLQRHLEPITTELKHPPITPHGPIRRIGFPEVGFSSMAAFGFGPRFEVGIIGREGLIGALPVQLVAACPHPQRRRSGREHLGRINRRKRS